MQIILITIIIIIIVVTIIIVMFIVISHDYELDNYSWRGLVTIWALFWLQSEGHS